MISPSAVRGVVWLLAGMTMPAPMALAAGVAGVAGGGDAVLVEPQPRAWGGASDSAFVVGVGDITPPNDLVTWGTSYSAGTGIAMYQTSAPSGSWVYQLHLPAGALLQRVDMEACDTSPGIALNFGISSGLVPGGAAADITPVGTTGQMQTPGCAFFPVTPTATTRIDNAGRNYWIFFFYTGTPGPTVTFHSFRVYYRLQVSPAPAVATFPNDVPTTHPVFRFVEAMAASGLTGGCGPGAFCPDNPVTRGQMAVFLSVALGLHFPN